MTEVCRCSDSRAASNSDLSVNFNGKAGARTQAECAAAQFVRFGENCLRRTIIPPPSPLMLTVCQDYVDALQGIDLTVGVIASNSDLDDENTNNCCSLNPDAERSIQSEEPFLMCVNDRAEAVRRLPWMI